MGRFVLLVLVAGMLWMLATGGLASHEAIGDKWWLVAMFPAIYFLGVTLLRD